jgi:hypothetical protein
MRGVRKRKRSGELSPEVLHAFAWDFLLAGQGYKYPMPERRRLWKAHREAILTHCIEFNRRRCKASGRRPSLFWEDLKRQGRKRRRLGYVEEVSVGDDGKPETYRTAVYESDREFLKRLGLLRGWEKTPGGN